MIRSLKRHKIIFQSAGIGFLLTVALYLLSNLSIPFSSENRVLKWMYQITSPFRNADAAVPGNMVFINTSYDRELVPVHDSFGFERGNIDITDRTKLISLLQLLNRSGDYRYILLDIRFEDGLHTPVDSTLWQLIRSTPRIVIPAHEGMGQASPLLEPKSAQADFLSSIEEGDFTKYIVVPAGAESMAYRAYRELTGNTYTSVAGFYFSEGHLMKRAMFPNLKININTELDHEGYLKIHQLGADILNDPAGSAEMFRGKLIFVGDLMENDRQSTYKGPMHGAVIHANALNDLLEGNHLIGWWTLAFIWLLLSALVYATLTNLSAKRFLANPARFPKRIRESKYWPTVYPATNFLLSLIGYGTIFTAAFITIYLLTSQIYEIIAISAVFVLIPIIKKLTAK